jgi:hypothetical protein
MRTLMLATLLAVLTGCQSQTPPLVQVYAARQTYTASLDGLTTAINSGAISDRATLVQIRDIRKQIEKGLDDAEVKARAGDKIGAQFILNEVSGWLETYLTLTKPRPATRPSTLNTETPWTPQRSSPSSSVALRQLPDWYRLMKPSPLAGNSVMSRWQASAPSRLLLRPETMPR